ncbi:MAG TPA: uroporphyrinogen decarboxylase family protein [Dictyoglomaceae bacterium]|nr:uroporphyrinogen decarboxylase family protein [Dictyoglomaceae bacterium]HOL39332.1 uroporphyrinogen decarboxylase family protein [Dictyoglomaceae bacterium]HPP15986.1 uroporphyrinogen decarboxylase family protein [Dictyoglomaceae bacterium]
MNDKEWQILLDSANLKEQKEVPIALIVDSPWIPGFLGISHLQFYVIPEVWLEAYKEIKKRFPEVIFIPDYWVELGMAQEPSGFGSKIVFSDNSTPNIQPIIESADDLPDFLKKNKVPNPKTDGLMPLVLEFYKYVEPKINKMGEKIKIVAARGPFAIASHIMGVTEFLIAVKMYPDEAKRLIEITTKLAIDWITAQTEVLQDVEGIILLDDIIGFFSEEDYLEFAHSALKKIFSSFDFPVKIYHNDTNNAVYYKYLPELGINIFNFTHLQNIKEVYKVTQGKICLMGNVPPLDVLVKGTEDDVRKSVESILRGFGKDKGLLLSAGGGVSPGTPEKNIRALIETAKNWKF